MSTNYYLKRRPTLGQINDLQDLVQRSANEYLNHEIKSIVDEIYGESIHIGHRACGWKFLWNANTTMNYDGTVETMYPLTRDGIRNFIMQDEYILVNEYNEVENKEEFLNMAFNWGIDDGYDSETYHQDNPSEYRFDVTRDQERFKKLGFKFKNDYQSDFYSDGLRFSVIQEFS